VAFGTHCSSYYFFALFFLPFHGDDPNISALNYCVFYALMTDRRWNDPPSQRQHQKSIRQKKQQHSAQGVPDIWHKKAPGSSA
jgi:hypothetical protein